jgi:hypothetical protein
VLLLLPVAALLLPLYHRLLHPLCLSSSLCFSPANNPMAILGAKRAFDQMNHVIVASIK